MTYMDGKFEDLNTLNETIERNILNVKTINQTLQNTTNDVKTLETTMGKFKLICFIAKGQ